jgi:hypothetical protein
MSIPGRVSFPCYLASVPRVKVAAEAARRFLELARCDVLYERREIFEGDQQGAVVRSDKRVPLVSSCHGP